MRVISAAQRLASVVQGRCCVVRLLHFGAALVPHWHAWAPFWRGGGALCVRIR